jgi:hypothetical protein
MAPLCPPESALMDEWGHVRRGYTPKALEELFGSKPLATASFINPITAFYHDVAFSRLGRRSRLLLYLATAPLVAPAYAMHGRGQRGTERAFAWRK